MTVSKICFEFLQQFNNEFVPGVGVFYTPGM